MTVKLSMPSRPPVDDLARQQATKYGRATLSGAESDGLDVELKAKRDMLNRLLDSIREPNRMLSVLDIGCYDGLLLRALRDDGIEKHGLDISAECVEIARERHGVKAKVADVSGPLPYADGSFDLVIASEIIEHLVDTDAFLREISRVLSDRGWAFVSTPNVNSLRNRFRVLLGLYPAQCEYRLIETSTGHVRVYNKNALCGQLRERGFEVMDVRCTHVLPAGWSQSKLSYWLSTSLGGRLFPTLGQGLCVLARKVGV